MKIQHSIFLLLLTFFILLPSTGKSANTQIAVPKYFNITAYILDDAGHILSNKTQEADFTFRVKDAAGKVQYTEKQHLQVVDGAISAFVGQGSEAGLPVEALNPDGDHILEIQMEGQTVPQEKLLLASVPYALYADKLSGGVKSDDIEDGTIAKDDLSSELMDFINNSVAGISEQEMTDHRTQFGEHSAKQIFVENHFVNTAGDDLQTVLQGLDNAILVHNDKITNDRTSLTNHISASNTNAHSFSNISGQVTGAQIAPGTITITNLDVTTSLGAWDQNASDDITTTTQFSGDVSGTASNIKIKSGSVGTTEIADNAITGAKVQDGSLSLSDFSTTTFDKWDTDKNDDVTTSTQFGGDLSGTANNLQITAGSIVTSDMASQNISQWNNDSQYITDGNTNWDNSYGFLTASDLAGYNFLTASSLTGYDSNASDDLTTITQFGGDVTGTADNLKISSTALSSYLTSSTASTTYLKQSGGAITGSLTVGDGKGTDSLTVNGDISTTGTVDDVDVSALNTRVGKIIHVTQSGNDITTKQQIFFRSGTLSNGASIPEPVGYGSTGICMCTGGLYDSFGDGGAAAVAKTTVKIDPACKDAIVCTWCDESTCGDPNAIISCKVNYMEICLE